MPSIPIAKYSVLFVWLMTAFAGVLIPNSSAAQDACHELFSADQRESSVAIKNESTARIFETAMRTLGADIIKKYGVQGIDRIRLINAFTPQAQALIVGNLAKILWERPNGLITSTDGKSILITDERNQRPLTFHVHGRGKTFPVQAAFSFLTGQISYYQQNGKALESPESYFMEPADIKSASENLQFIFEALRKPFYKFMRTFEILKAVSPLEEDRIFTFVEDHREWKVPILFKTNYPGDVKQLEMDSWANSERSSDSFKSFSRRLESLGYRVEHILEFPRNSQPPEGTPVVKGGSSNY